MYLTILFINAKDGHIPYCVDEFGERFYVRGKMVFTTTVHCVHKNLQKNVVIRLF